MEELKKYDKSCRVLIYNEELEDCKESYYVKSIDELKNNEVLLVEEGYTEVNDLLPDITNYYDHPVFLVLKAKKDCNIENDIECSVHDIKCKLYEFAKSLLDKGYTMEDLYNILDEESYKTIKKLLS